MKEIIMFAEREILRLFSFVSHNFCLQMKELKFSALFYLVIVLSTSYPTKYFCI